MDDRAKRYNAIKNRLALTEPLILLLFLAVMQLSGVSVKLRYISTNLYSAWYKALAIYAAVFSLIYYAVTFYLHFYKTFIIEQRFGLSNQKLSDWIKDDLKGYAVSLILFLIFIEFLYFLLRNTPESWWFFMALGWILLTIVLAKLAPVLIIPLFFKYEDLKDNELKKRLMQLAERSGVKVLDVFKLKMSSKTKKANAALVGIGKTRRVLLGDTLLENYAKDEIEVVLAHEIAHHKFAHIWKTVLFSGASALFVFYLVSLSSHPLTIIFGLKGITDIAAFPSIMFAMVLFALLISPLQNAFSRKLETSADLFTLKTTGLSKAFISCMNKLAKQNLSDPSPSRLIEITLYDHPPISRRIKMAESLQDS